VVCFVAIIGIFDHQFFKLIIMIKV